VKIDATISKFGSAISSLPEKQANSMSSFLNSDPPFRYYLDVLINKIVL
jgi:hypothetical protein